MTAYLSALEPQCCIRKYPIHLHTLYYEYTSISYVFLFLNVIFYSVNSQILAQVCWLISLGSFLNLYIIHWKLQSRRASIHHEEVLIHDPIDLTPSSSDCDSDKPEPYVDSSDTEENLIYSAEDSNTETDPIPTTTFPLSVDSSTQEVIDLTPVVSEICRVFRNNSDITVQIHSTKPEQPPEPEKLVEKIVEAEKPVEKLLEAEKPPEPEQPVEKPPEAEQPLEKPPEPEQPVEKPPEAEQPVEKPPEAEQPVEKLEPEKLMQPERKRKHTNSCFARGMCYS